MQEAVRSKGQAMVEDARQKLERLRATGPNPFDYWIWADETVQKLDTIYGREADQTQDFAAIVYERGRTRDQRGAFDNMTLGLHGPWGIRARLDRAAAHLDILLGRTPIAPSQH